jgi:hypothetical protein
MRLAGALPEASTAVAAQDCAIPSESAAPKAIEEIRLTPAAARVAANWQATVFAMSHLPACAIPTRRSNPAPAGPCPDQLEVDMSNPNGAMMAGSFAFAETST